MKDIDLNRLRIHDDSSVGPGCARINSHSRGVATVSVVIMGLWAICLIAGLAGRSDKLVAIGVMAWLAMVVGVLIATRLPRAARWVAWADGIAAGAMVASACVFLLPMAMRAAPDRGALGVAGGLLVGNLLHLWARHRRLDGHAADASLIAITLHAVGAGFVIGLIYVRMPSLGLVLGVAIVAHKLPAGYVLARWRTQEGLARHPVLWPACAVALVSIPVGLWVSPGAPADNALLFGLATGVFMSVGLDFFRPQEVEQPTTAWPGFMLALIAGAGLVIVLKYGVVGG